MDFLLLQLHLVLQILNLEGMILSQLLHFFLALPFSVLTLSQLLLQHPDGSLRLFIASSLPESSFFKVLNEFIFPLDDFLHVRDLLFEILGFHIKSLPLLFTFIDLNQDLLFSCLRFMFLIVDLVFIFLDDSRKFINFIFARLQSHPQLGYFLLILKLLSVLFLTFRNLPLFHITLVLFLQLVDLFLAFGLDFLDLFGKLKNFIL